MQAWKDPERALTEFDGEPFLAIRFEHEKGTLTIGKMIKPTLGRLRKSFGIDIALERGGKQVYSSLEGWSPALGREGTLYVGGIRYLALPGVLAGMVVTGIVQSSSITTGLCILLVQQTILPATAAIPIVIGANIGTTVTALVASIKMQKTARQVALANLCFNTFGVVLFLPFLGWFAAKVVGFAGEPGVAVAWAQLIFNLAMTLAVLILLRIFQRRVELLDSTQARAATTVST